MCGGPAAERQGEGRRWRGSKVRQRGCRNRSVGPRASDPGFSRGDKRGIYHTPCSSTLGERQLQRRRRSQIDRRRNADSGGRRPSGACFYRIAVDPTDPDIAYAATNVGLYRTKNGGGTEPVDRWSSGVSSTVLACTDIVIDPTDRDVAYAPLGERRLQDDERTAGSPPGRNWPAASASISTHRPSDSTAPANVYALVANRVTHSGLLRLGEQRWHVVTVAAASGVVDVYGVHAQRRGGHLDTEYRLPLGVELAWRSGQMALGRDERRLDHSSGQPRVREPPDDHLTSTPATTAGSTSRRMAARWSDHINESRDHTVRVHQAAPTSDAYVISGTQDSRNGVFRNHPAFYHSDDGDGGWARRRGEPEERIVYVLRRPPQRPQGGKF
jgi:hypothetical protein